MTYVSSTYSIRSFACAISLLLLMTFNAFAYNADSCTSTSPDDHAACVAMIGAVRSMMSDEFSTDPACARSDTDDIYVIDGVIDWIRQHPDRQDEDLANLVREALLNVDPCVQRSLVPNPTPDQMLGDPIDSD